MLSLSLLMVSPLLVAGNSWFNWGWRETNLVRDSGYGMDNRDHGGSWDVVDGHREDSGRREDYSRHHGYRRWDDHHDQLNRRPSHDWDDHDQLNRRPSHHDRDDHDQLNRRPSHHDRDDHDQ